MKVLTSTFVEYHVVKLQYIIVNILDYTLVMN